VVGLSPHQYLFRCRLRHAHALLSAADEKRSLADVAAECVFSTKLIWRGISAVRTE
jgi:transcriptional regulator GlxA family with amidase domain